MPVLTALIANQREKAVAWQNIAMPLIMICAGLLAANLHTMTSTPPSVRQNAWLGTIMALAALVIWIAYGTANAAVMRRADAPDALRWTGLQGIGAALGSVILLPLAKFDAPGEAFAGFAIWAIIMGVAGSWLATWLWAIASRRLPLTLSAQLIIAETVFGLGYGFLYDERWPTALEITGCGLQIIGVALGIRMITITSARRVIPENASV